MLTAPAITTDWFEQFQLLMLTYAVPLLWKVVGAIVLWIVGGWLIGVARNLLRRSMSVRQFDATVAAYVDSALAVVLRIMLIVAIFGVFGVESTSFAALLAAAGVAIGMAWSGLLANFAAGVFLILLRPFRVGDTITVAGVTGLVREIGMFATSLDTVDNLRVIVGNNRIFSDNITNYNTNAFRRVELTAQIAHGVEPLAAIERLKALLRQVPNRTQEPLVDIREFNASGTLLVIHQFCHPDHFGQVLSDTNRAILAASAEGGYPVPAVHHISRTS